MAAAAGESIILQAGKKVTTKVIVEGAKRNILSKEDAKSIESYKELITTHETKLAEYIKNPMKYDNKEILKNAPSDLIRDKIIQSRVRHLYHEIITFKNNIQKILKGK